jgi:hypothetical protein
LNFQDVVVGGDGEVGARQGEGQVWKRVTLIAFNGVLAIEAFLGANFLVAGDN